MIIKSYSDKRIKITVEEVTPDKYIATCWNKENCLEYDRTVYEFETSGGALFKAFDLLTEEL